VKQADQLLFSQVRSSSGAASRERARELLDFVGLKRKDELAMNLPYGDQRRLEIARALGSDPHLLLLDEPTAGMNPQESEELRQLMERLRSEQDISVLLIEHDMKVVMNVSDHITVTSVVGRFLEHSRVFAFTRGDEQRVFIGSADLMPRNLDHRVELAVPIEAPQARAELLDTLERCFADNQSSWDLDASGIWHRRSPAPGEEPRSVQQELTELYAARAATERPAGEHDGQPPGGREIATPAGRGAPIGAAQPVAAAGSASRASLSSSTD